MDLQFVFGNPRRKKPVRKQMVKRAKNNKKLGCKPKKNIASSHKYGKIISVNQFGLEKEKKDITKLKKSGGKRMKSVKRNPMSLKNKLKLAARMKVVNLGRTANLSKSAGEGILTRAYGKIEKGDIKGKTKLKDYLETAAKRAKTAPTTKKVTKKVVKKVAKKVSKKVAKKVAKKVSKKVAKKVAKKVVRRATAPSRSAEIQRVFKKFKSTYDKLSPIEKQKATKSKRKFETRASKRRPDGTRARTVTRVSKLRKGKGLTIRHSTYNNPFGGKMKGFLNKDIRFTAHNGGEVVSLAVGGGLSGFVTQGLDTLFTQAWMPSAVKTVYAKIPTDFAILAFGVGLNALSERVKPTNAVKLPLDLLGKGLVAAAVIKLASLSTSKLTGAALSGVDYTPYAGVDYSPTDSRADFGAVDYSPSEQGADFGEYEQSNADFGGLPEGLGSQLGALEEINSDIQMS